MSIQIDGNTIKVEGAELILQGSVTIQGMVSTDGETVPGPGVDTTAVHVGETTTGSVALTGDVEIGGSMVIQGTVTLTGDPLKGGAPASGLLADRPSAAAAGERTEYIATDVSGGTRYQVQGGVWVTPGVTVYTERIWAPFYGAGAYATFTPDGQPLTATVVGGMGLGGAGLVMHQGTQQVWLTDPSGSTARIIRVLTDGTAAAADLTDDSLNSPAWVLQVDTLVWVTNQGNNTISLFHTDGTSGGDALTDASFNQPNQLFLVGTGASEQVWVANAGAQTITRLSLAGEVLGVLSPSGLDTHMQMLAVGDDLVLVTTATHTIMQLHADGSSAGADIAPVWLPQVNGLAHVGTEVVAALVGTPSPLALGRLGLGGAYLGPIPPSSFANGIAGLLLVPCAPYALPALALF